MVPTSRTPLARYSIGLVVIAVALSIYGVNGGNGAPVVPADYTKARTALVDAEAAQRFDSGETLSAAERVVNQHMLELKQEQRQAPLFLPAEPFATVKHRIVETELYQVLQSMPKGAMLHVHDGAAVDVDWIVSNVTYRPGCYLYTGTGEGSTPPSFERIVSNFRDGWSGLRSHPSLARMDLPHAAPTGRDARHIAGMASAAAMSQLRAGRGLQDPSIMTGTFQFFDKAPSAEWASVAELRAKWQPRPGLPTFDDYARSLLSVNETAFNEGALNAWSVFQKFFTRSNLLGFRPVFSDLWRRVLTNFAVRDNVARIEVRAPVPELYELDGSTHTAQYSVDLLRCIVKGVAAETGAFVSLGIVVTGSRKAAPDDLRAFMARALELRLANPDMIVGFDVAGEEDKGNPLIYYAGLFLELAANATAAGTTLPLDLHVGETSWGTNPGAPTTTPQLNTSATNLYDALLLGSVRFGHALALPKFPVVMQRAKEAGVAVESCPISNQVLQYVDDLRDHPATEMLAAGMPVTISPDDPGPLGYNSVVYDWWMAYVAWDVDLASLKRMARDSVEHSLTNTTEKGLLRSTWQSQWDSWIADQVSTLGKVVAH